MANYSDKELVIILQEGNTSKCNEVISQLYKKCYSPVLDFILKNSGTKSDCEDVFQETMEVFYYQIQRDIFQGKSTITTYFCGIARNLWFGELRKRKHQHIEITPEIQISSDEQTLTVQNLQLFYGLFEQLEEDCRKVLKYFYFEGLSMIQIMSKFSSLKSEQSARAKKYRCLKYLIAIFKKNKVSKSSFI